MGNTMKSPTIRALYSSAKVDTVRRSLELKGELLIKCVLLSTSKRNNTTVLSQSGFVSRLRSHYTVPLVFRVVNNGYDSRPRRTHAQFKEHRSGHTARQACSNYGAFGIWQVVARV